MNKKRLLWFLIVANVLLAFGSVGAEGFFSWTLPPALAAYRHDRGGAWDLPGAFRLMLVGTTALVAFASWIGLASFWRHARGLFVFSIALDILFRFVAGPLVTPSVGAAFRMADAITAGMILGLVYFSDLARAFEKRPHIEASPNWQAHIDRA
jgi:hypothetical protein